MAREPFDTLAPLVRRGKPVAFAFVLDRLDRLSPYTRPMFGCTAVYVDERIVFVLRERGDSDDGVWVAFAPEAEAQVRAILPRLQDIDMFGGNVRGWKKLAATSAEFEEDVELACSQVLAGNTHFGKVPVSRKPSKRARKPKPMSMPTRAAKHRRVKKKATRQHES